MQPDFIKITYTKYIISQVKIILVSFWKHWKIDYFWYMKLICSKFLAL